MTDDMTKTIIIVNANETKNADKESQRMERKTVKIDEDVFMKTLSKMAPRVADHLVAQALDGISEDEMPDEEMENYSGSCLDYYRVGCEDAQFVFREALNRLEPECGKEQLEVLVRHILAEESRVALADVYGYADPNGVSVVKKRWLTRLLQHAKGVLLEDVKGSLNPSPNRIGFLKPYLKWL